MADELNRAAPIAAQLDQQEQPKSDFLSHLAESGKAIEGWPAWKTGLWNSDRAAQLDQDGCGRCPRDTPYGPATCGKCLEAEERLAAAQLDQDAERKFEAWWDKEGQFIRAGGGEYEKSFAYKAWMDSRTAPVAAQLDAELPLLPYTKWSGFDPATGKDFGYYRTEEVEQIRRDAIAPYAERIRLLERAQASKLSVEKVVELGDQSEFEDPETGRIDFDRLGFAHAIEREVTASRAASRAQLPAQSIEEDNKFQCLLYHYVKARSKMVRGTPSEDEATAAFRELIAYIDGRTAGTAPEAAPEAVSVMLWLYRRLPHCYGRPPHVEAPITALAKVAGVSMKDVTESFAERGAAPSPQENTK